MRSFAFNQMNNADSYQPTLSADTSAASTTASHRQLRLAVADISNGLTMWPLWGRLGWNDIAQRYRRSLLGPFWLTASMAVMVIALGFVYSQIFKTTLRDFMPFLCIGLLVWGFVSSVITEAGTLFTGAESYIKQIKLPFSLYVFRFIWSRLIIFAHNFVIYFGIIIYFQIWPGLAGLCFLPGLAVLVLNGVLASYYLGMASTRFRDIPPIVGSIVQILFFLTPIMWKPSFLGDKSFLVALNPFYHLIEIVRAPLLGSFPTAVNWWVAAGITLLNFLVALAFFTRFRSRISYWI